MEGQTEVVEHGHFLILGYSEKCIPIISELSPISSSTTAALNSQHTEWFHVPHKKDDTTECYTNYHLHSHFLEAC